jgi:hypothetical protein
MGFHKTLTSPPTHPLSPVIPTNAWTSRITAAAGTRLAGPSSGADHGFSLLTAVYTTKLLHPARGIAPSHFRALRNIRYCSLP